MRVLYTLTIFLSSALLFLVQPMVARIILPAYGGTASVWTSSELFFQFVLLLGYGYAHLSTRKIGLRRQPWIHIPLMAVAMLTLPFATRVAGGAEGENSPVLRLLGQLAVMVGLAFFVVSAGAPLIQRWFAETKDPHAKDPYFLYSASNLGSMVALLAYPVLVEPHLRLSDQARLWWGGFAGLMLLMAMCAIVLSKNRRPEVLENEADETDQDRLIDQTVAESGQPEITTAMRLKWITLAAIPSSLLLGVTAYVSTNIAPIPLLWVVPLAIYLLTFILAFANKPLLTSKPLGRLSGILIPTLMVAVVMEAFMPLLSFLHVGVFFVVAWMCHAMLSESRPRAKHLTEFYFWMSVGGVVGGAFNALVAPVIFNTLFEYPLALIAAAVVMPAYRPGFKRTSIDFAYPLGVAFVTAVIVLITKATMEPSQLRTGIGVGVPALLCYLAVDRPQRFAMSLFGMVVVANGLGIASTDPIKLSERSFFGVHRVMFYGEHQRFHQLTHGNTKHGIQDFDNPTVPLTYYHPSGPIGAVFKAYSGPFKKENVALIGLGVGSLAAYGEPGQNMTFFEIDPTVKALATNPTYFTYVRDSKAKVDIVLGDGRLELAKEPDGRYGLIVLDAFSSDSIPVHLLTEEAAKMYLSKLAPDGILAYHISNRYLELDGVVAAIARDLGLVTYVDVDGITDQEAKVGKTASIWMVLARKQDDLARLVKSKPHPKTREEINRLTEASAWSERIAGDKDQAWTDDFSNVLGVLKRED